MNATADVPSSRLKNYRGGGDRKDRSLFAARLAAIFLLVVSIAAAAAAFLVSPLRSLVRSLSSASASFSCVLWLFVVVVITAAIWITHHATAPPHRDGVHFASGWSAQLWQDDEIHPPTMSEYYYYDNDVNATGESAFEAEATRKNTRVMEPPKEEEEGEEDESMDATWEAIVRRRGVRKSEENSTKDDVIDLPRRVVYKEGGVKEKKKKGAEGWRKREAAAEANDELFRRVETFIKKHYDHLRMQRQESEQRRLLEMFGRRGRS